MRKRSKLSGAGDRGPRNQSCLTGSLPGRANSAVEREGQGEALGMWASGARSGPKFPPEASPRLLSSGLAWALALGPGACTMWRKMGGGLMFTDQAKQSRRRFELSGAIEI